MKTKILYLVTKSNWGGAQKYVYDLATSIPKNKYNVIVAFGGGGVLKEKLIGEEGIRTIQIESLGRDISMFKDIRAFLEILTLFIREKPNIVHLNSSKIGLLGSLAAKLCGMKKTVFTVHGWAFNEKLSKKKFFVIKIMSKLTAKLSTDLIVLSEKEGSQTSEFVPDNKIHLIRNGIDPNMKFLSKEESLNNLDLDKRHKYIGTIAELHRNKGLDVLISAFANLDENIHLAIIGSGEEKENLEKLRDHSGLSSRVHFLGHIDNAGIYIKAFEIFVLPSRKEGLPYTILEAGLSKVPVVSTNVGGISSIISDDSLGFLVKPESEERLREKIELLLDNEKLGEDIGDALSQRIRDEFNIENTRKETFRLYSNQD